MIPLVIGIIIVVIIVCASVGVYNNLVTLRNRIDNAWQNIDTQLQRRCDLILNLVETVKGYAKHEKETLEAVISARNATASAVSPDEKMEANNVLSGALRQLFAVAESYPDLKANTNFMQLQATLEDTENKVSYARQSYNDCVLTTTTPSKHSPASSLPASSNSSHAPGSRPAPNPARLRRFSSSHCFTCNMQAARPST